jgi:hypothetical protein
MTAARFTLVIGGQTMHGVAFASEAALDAYIASHSHLTFAPDPPSTPPAIAVPLRPQGRPSYAAMIAAAVKAIAPALDGLDGLSARARCVQRHLALTDPAQQMPARRTIEAYLAAKPSTRKRTS